MALIHNGIYTNVRETADRYALELGTECDSEIAARLIEQSGSLARGLLRCLRELRESQALAVLDSRTGSIWCCRDEHRPLWIARLRDGRRTIMASTPTIIEVAVDRIFHSGTPMIEEMFPIAAGFIHEISVDGRIRVA